MNPSGSDTLADVRAAWRAAGIEHFMAESDGRISLSQIVVPKELRGKGIGTSAMKQLMAYADRTGRRIELTPSSDFGGSKARLEKFYGSLGFVKNKGRNKDFSISESMYRLPNIALAGPGRDGGESPLSVRGAGERAAVMDAGEAVNKKEAGLKFL